MKHTLRHSGAATRIAVAALLSLPAAAANAQGSDEAIEEVIVTGVPGGGATKLEASVSVSSLPAEEND